MHAGIFLSFTTDPNWPELGPVKPHAYWSTDTQLSEIPWDAVQMTYRQLAVLNDDRDSWRYDWQTGEFYQPPQLGRRYLRVVEGRIVEISAEERAVLDLQDFRAEKERVIQRIAERRYQAECAGVVVDGIPIHTDRESQSCMTAAFVSAQAGLFSSLRWKCQDGQFRELTATQVVSIAQVLLGYVQACFDRERVLRGLLGAVVDMDHAGLAGLPIGGGWPDREIALAP